MDGEEKSAGAGDGFAQDRPVEKRGIGVDRKLVEGKSAAEAVGLLGVAAGDGKAGEPIRRQPEIESRRGRDRRSRVVRESRVRIAHLEPGDVSRYPGVIVPRLGHRTRGAAADGVYRAAGRRRAS